MALWHQYCDKSEIFQLDENHSNFLCLYIDLNKNGKSKPKATLEKPSKQLENSLFDNFGKFQVKHAIELSTVKKDELVVSFLKDNELAIINDIDLLVCGFNEIDQDIDSSFKRRIFVRQERIDNPSLLEKHFKNIKTHGYAGIAFNIEEITRGYVALAHKFNLKIAITSVKHERQLEKAQSSNADEIITV